MIFSEITVSDTTRPLLAFAIHNGHYLPPALEENCGISPSQRLQEEDPFTDGFAGCFANNVVLQTCRFAVDLNRSPEKCVYQNPEDAWGLQVRKSSLGQELINELQQAYATWYRIAAYQVDKLLMEHKRILILDLHSYNHRRGGPKAGADPQAGNPDIIIGRNNLPEKRYPEAEQLRLRLDGTRFMGKALDCRCDVKFPGGYFSRWLNNSYQDRILCLAIEFKKIFMDEWSGELNLKAYQELKQLFANAVESFLSGWIQG